MPVAVSISICACMQDCDSPADVWKACTLLVPVCQLTIPVDSPGSDAQIPFPCNLGVRVRMIAAPHGVNDTPLLRRIASCTHPDDLLDVVTAALTGVSQPHHS